MEITGILKQKSDEQQISEKFKKRDFVITEYHPQYPQHISFQLTQDKCSLLDKYSEGSEIKVHFNLRGREYTNKEGVLMHFNTLEAWRLENGNATEKKEDVAHQANIDDAKDDLPF